MSFASDNAAPIHPAILAAMAEANRGHAPSYGADAWTLRAEAMLHEVFETDCAVLMLPTGTAANAISLSALAPPWGAVFCHRAAHIAQDEAGAPEFFTGGARLLLLDGVGAKIAPEDLDLAASGYSRAWVHGAQPFAVSITQASESGCVYQPNEIAALGQVCRERGLHLHMDGARFANALASTGASPADLSWRSGVSILSFGATKNGAMGLEAILCFDPALKAALPHLRKRAGQLLSKHRYLAAQMVGYLEGGLWLELAAHANAMARHLGEGLRQAGGVLRHHIEANSVFIDLSPDKVARLEAAGARSYPWLMDGPLTRRFVCSWASTQAEVDGALAALRP